MYGDNKLKAFIYLSHFSSLVSANQRQLKHENTTTHDEKWERDERADSYGTPVRNIFFVFQNFNLLVINTISLPTKYVSNSELAEN